MPGTMPPELLWAVHRRADNASHSDAQRRERVASPSKPIPLTPAVFSPNPAPGTLRDRTRRPGHGSWLAGGSAPPTRPAGHAESYPAGPGGSRDDDRA